MSRFKEMVMRDMKSVLLNPNEFGEIHLVEGKEVMCVIDLDKLLEKQNASQFDISEASLLIYAPTSDLPKRKGVGSILRFDHKEYIVVDWVENFGVSEIILNQNRIS